MNVRSLVCIPRLPRSIPGKGLAQSDRRERVVESILPSLDSNSSCWSVVELQNLGNREVAAEVEAHKATGALAPLAGQSGIQMRLSAGEHVEYKLQLPEETNGAWVRIRETIPSPKLSAVLAVSGATEAAVAADELRNCTVATCALAHAQSLSFPAT